LIVTLCFGAFLVNSAVWNITGRIRFSLSCKTCLVVRQPSCILNAVFDSDVSST